VTFEEALAEAGGPAAPPTATAGLRRALLSALEAGGGELAKARSGYESPVLVAFAGERAVLPLDAAYRADPSSVPERAFVVAAAAVAALAEVAGLAAPAGRDDLALTAGDLEGHLVLGLPGATDPELAALAFDERVEDVDRLRARGLAVPAALLAEAELRPPIGATHPLRVAEALARLGHDPIDPPDGVDDQLPAILGTSGEAARPHDDPDPARRIARRILQRLSGMGKWGGYHTEFAHLPRGFAGNDRALAMDVGEALLGAGLLEEKPSVGQRHVYLNPRRAAEIYALIERGDVPAGLRLPSG
jgi:hypothetical protein